MARMSKKEKEKYEERAVIIDGDMLPPEDSRVIKAKAELKTVEQMYVNATVDNFLDKIEEKKQEIESKIEQYIRRLLLLVLSMVSLVTMGFMFLPIYLLV